MSDRPDSNQHAHVQSGTATESRAGSSASAARSAATPQGKPLANGKRQFVIAPRRPDPIPDLQPQTLDVIEQSLKSTPEIELIESARPHTTSNILIARMSDDKAEALRQQSRGQLIVDLDCVLHLSYFDPGPRMVTGIAAAVGPELSLSVAVLGKDNTAVKDAEVYLFGCLDTASGLTDERGQVTLSLSGETVQSIRSIYVKPKSDYWTYFQEEPALETGQPNLVFLRSLADTFPNFPRQQVLGWGQRTMRLDQLPPVYRGQGVKVGIIDSGIATSHIDLHRIKAGADLLKKNGATSWNQDTVSHGSHCAGIIGAAENSLGIRGFAPESEIHICKIFPGGRLSHLSEALEYCIENQIDVASVNLGATERSEALDQQLLRAKRAGVALIAAAGNSSGAVEFPASSPHVLAVAAIGKWGEFPPESYHAQMVAAIDPNGFFSPKFTCFGPEVALCAPGVAILSCVPPNNYAVRDGTSSAAAHVAGLAALVLAHHPDFQGAFRARNADRVDRLFHILTASTQPVHFGDPRRSGFGVPDVLIALGLAPGALWLSGFVQPNVFNRYVQAPANFGRTTAYQPAVAGKW